MKNICLALVLGLVGPSLAVAQSTPLAPSTDTSRYYAVDDVKPGLKGYGQTIFQGSTLERFDVEFLGVLEGVPNPKQKLILARLAGPNVDRTRVFGGMSGSPVYVDGKMVGAVAYAFPFATEAIAGITPIGQMIGQLKETPPAAQSTRGDFSFKNLVESRGRTASEPSAVLSTVPAPEAIPGTAVVSAAPSLAAYAGQSMRPIATPIAFSGIPQSVIDRFAPEFQRLGLQPVAGVSAGGAVEPIAPHTEKTLAPGATVVVSLIRGDYNAGATGTVTERVGDRVYAFGHPFLSLGATGMPMSEANVITVVPNVNNSFKIAQATNYVGTIAQDRSTGIAGQLGQKVKMVPVTVKFTNSHGATDTYRYEVVNDPMLTPLFINMTLLATVVGTERQMGDQTIDLSGTIRLDGQPEIKLVNRFSGASNAAAAASMSVAQPLQLLMNSGFKDVSVGGVEVAITATEERHIGALTGLRVDKTRVGRGERVELQAFARTEDGHEFVERIPVEIPRDAPIGKLTLVVGDGATLVSSDETFAGFAPQTLRQLVDGINKLKKNDRLYVKVVRATGGAVVGNQAMTALPPSVLSSLGSPRATQGVTQLQTSTLSEKELPPARFVVTGQQTITVDVVR
jgi:hypothetical protein